MNETDVIYVGLTNHICTLQKLLRTRTPKIIESSSKDLPKINPKFTQDLLKIRPFLVFYLVKTNPSFTLKLLKIYSTYSEHTIAAIMVAV